MADKELQIIRCLQRMEKDYGADYDPCIFGIPAPDTLMLRNEYGGRVVAYEVCPDMPIGVVICLSGVDSPSTSAYYGHAREFFKLGFATVLLDVSGHIKEHGKAYEEVKDVQAVTDYLRAKMEFANLPIVAFGVAMGGTVAMRSMIRNYDINAVVSISAFASFEDYFAFNRSEADPMYDLPNSSPEQMADMSHTDSLALSNICKVKGIDRRPVLLMQSKGDKLVPYTYYERLLGEARKCTNELDTYVVEGDQHYICHDFINPIVDREYFRTLVSFLNRMTLRLPHLAQRKLEDTQAI